MTKRGLPGPMDHQWRQHLTSHSAVRFCVTGGMAQGKAPAIVGERRAVPEERTAIGHLSASLLQAAREQIASRKQQENLKNHPSDYSLLSVLGNLSLF